jgi:hypothetical protein
LTLPRNAIDSGAIRVPAVVGRSNTRAKRGVPQRANLPQFLSGSAQGSLFKFTQREGGTTVLRKIAFAFVTLVLFLGISTATFAQKTTVIRVVIVKTDNPAAYAEAIEKGKEIIKKAGVSANIHVYQATYAGPETGTVGSVIEYPSLQALADADAKLRADKDYAEWIKGLNKIRTIVSDSIYREL